MSIRILCVDDERHVLRTLERFCRNEGFEMLAVQSAAEGLESLARETVQVIVSDYRMPGMNGLDFLRQVRRTSRVPGILLSGYADIPAVTQALQEKEIFAFLAKPWRREELLAAVLAAAEGAQEEPV